MGGWLAEHSKIIFISQSGLTPSEVKSLSLEIQWDRTEQKSKLWNENLGRGAGEVVSVLAF